MEQIPLFDAHCDSISFFLDSTEDTLSKSSGHLDLERVGGFAPYAQFFALFADSAARGPSMDIRYRILLERFCREVSRNSDRVVHCRTAREK